MGKQQQRSGRSHFLTVWITYLRKQTDNIVLTCAREKNWWGGKTSTHSCNSCLISDQLKFGPTPSHIRKMTILHVPTTIYSVLHPLQPELSSSPLECHSSLAISKHWNLPFAEGGCRSSLLNKFSAFRKQSLILSQIWLPSPITSEIGCSTSFQLFF